MFFLIRRGCVGLGSGIIDAFYFAKRQKANRRLLVRWLVFCNFALCNGAVQRCLWQFVVASFDLFIKAFAILSWCKLRSLATDRASDPCINGALYGVALFMTAQVPFRYKLHSKDNKVNVCVIGRRQYYPM